MKRKLLSIIVIFALVISFGGIMTNMAYVNNQTQAADLSKIVSINEIDEVSLRKYVSGKLPRGAKITSIHWKIVYFDKRNIKNSYGSITPLWDHPGYYITNVKGPYEFYDASYLAKVAGGLGLSTIHMIQTTTVSNSFHASIGIDPKVVNTGVGFDVTQSREVMLQCGLPIPAGKYGAIEAHTIYDSYNYDIVYSPVFGSPYKVGYGNANKAIGIFYLTYTWSE